MPADAATPEPTWHPIWCVIDTCNGENHVGQQTRWELGSDDVVVSIHSRRWDEGQRGSARYDCGIPKVAIDFENIGSVNNDGSKIKADAHFDAEELELLIRFLSRELQNVKQSGCDDMPVYAEDRPVAASAGQSYTARVAAQVATVMADRPALTVDQLGVIADMLGCSTSDLLPFHLAGASS